MFCNHVLQSCFAIIVLQSCFAASFASKNCSQYVPAACRGLRVVSCSPTTSNREPNKQDKILTTQTQQRENTQDNTKRHRTTTHQRHQPKDQQKTPTEVAPYSSKERTTKTTKTKIHNQPDTDIPQQHSQDNAASKQTTQHNTT